MRVEGRKTFAATGGKPFDPAKPALIFIHGAGIDHTVWTLQTRYFAHHGRSVLAVDLPGHGRSESAPVGSIEAYSEWIGQLIEAAGVARAALAGHSMGALIALETAARMPEKVSALALLGVAARMPVHPDLLAAADANDPLAFELVTSWGYGKAAHLGGNKAPGVWMLGGGKRLLERSAPGVLANDFRACDAYKTAADAASRISCPSLFVLGAADRMTPPKAAAPLANAMEGARTIVLPNAGHMMMIEQPDATLEALRSIL